MSKADEYLEEAADDRSQLFDTSPETNRLRNNERHRELCTAAIVEAIREVVKELKSPVIPDGSQQTGELSYMYVCERCKRVFGDCASSIEHPVCGDCRETKKAGLSFGEAIQAVADGKKARRPDWKRGAFIRSDKYGEIVFNNGDQATFFVRQVLATDWEVVE